MKAPTVLNGGGLTVAGGGAFSGDLYIGGSINGSGSSSSTYAYLTLTATDDAVNLSTGTLVSLGGLTLQSDANSANISNGGSILTPGGASIGKDVYIGGVLSLTKGVTNYYTEDDNVLNFFDSFNINSLSFKFSCAFIYLRVSFIDSSHSFSISSMLGTKPAPLYQQLATEENLPFLDETLPKLLTKKQYKSDAIHLNAQGYRLLAEALAELLKSSGAL